MEIPLTPGHWIAAFAPVAVLFGLVASGRLAARNAALVVAALAIVLAAAVFGAGPEVLGVGVAKGLWLGAWILAVVWPAMLLYQLASRAGLNRIGEVLAELFPNPSEKLLVLAWLLPSFVQGVAGFGTPIAVAAPLLVAAGWGTARAVAYPLVAYHWSVTFGSMGSSFYVAALTAHLGPGQTETFARDAAFILGVNALVAGAIVLVLEGGLRGLGRGVRMFLVAGVPMAATLFFVAPVVPAIGSVTAGAVGLAMAFGVAGFDRLRARPSWSAGLAAGPGTPRLRLRGRTRKGGAGAAVTGQGTPSGGDGRGAAWVVAPYLYLVGAALAVLLIPVSRQWVSSHVILSPTLPATTTGLGHHNDAAIGYTPLEVFGHPGTYLAFACVAGYITYRLVGKWPRGTGKGLTRDWLRSVKGSTISILALACVATVMRDAGMIATLARGLVTVAGQAYPVLAPLVGAVGSFLTGSSTSSNALFAVLQARVAGLIDVPPPVLLAAQAAGANVGNSVAPVVMLIGLNAVHAPGELPKVVRTVAVVTLILLGTVVGMTVLLVSGFLS